MKLYLDFECYSECDLPKTGADPYARHPSTGILCLGFAFEGERPQVYIPSDEMERAMGLEPIPFKVVHLLPPKVLAHIKDGGNVVCHNVAFDYLIWNKVSKWPKLHPEQLICTAAKATAMALPAALGTLGDALDVEVKKSPSGTRLITKMCKPPFQTGPKLLAEMAEYCAYDVMSMMEIDTHLMPLSSDERQVWLCNFRANQRGLFLDEHLICEAIRLSGLEDIELGQQAASIANLSLSALRSPKQLLEWCQSQGEPLNSLNKADLASVTIKDPLVQQVLDLRSEVCKTSIKKFTTMLACACPDGRARGNHVYHRATTGRFAGSGIQIQNLPRPQIADCDTVADYVVEHGELPSDLGVPVKTALSSLLRSCIMAPKGKKFYCADYSAIESRVLFWLAGEQKGLDVYRGGQDLYCVTASSIFGHPVNKKDHPNERSVGKVAVLSLGYQGGPKALQGMCDSMKVDLMGQDPQDIVDAYRGTYGKVKKFWADCEGAAMEAIKQPGVPMTVGKCRFRYSPSRQHLVCELPSKRLICWPRAQLLKDAPTFWGGTKDQIVYKGLGISRKWKEMKTYGGDIAQSLTQAVARDLLVDAMIRLDPKFPVILHVHDEIMSEVDENDNNYQTFLDTMATPPSWATDCPIDVAGFSARRYQK
jgi:DNA polymerase bacteriophage-type